MTNLVAVCLGGDNADPRNHRPQRHGDAQERIIWSGSRAATWGGALAWWQNGFRKDWRALYREAIGRDP
jgi:hypothetical protein